MASWNWAVRLALVAVLAEAASTTQWGDRAIKWNQGYAFQRNGNLYLYSSFNLVTPLQFPAGSVDTSLVLTDRSCETTFILKGGSAGCYLGKTEWDNGGSNTVSCYLSRDFGKSTGSLTVRWRGRTSTQNIGWGLYDDGLMNVKLACNGVDHERITCACSASKKTKNVVFGGQTVTAAGWHASLSFVPVSITIYDAVATSGDPLRHYGLLAKTTSAQPVEIRNFRFDEGSVVFKKYVRSACRGERLYYWNPWRATPIPSADSTKQNVFQACLREPACDAIQGPTGWSHLGYTFQTGELDVKQFNFDIGTCYVKEFNKCPVPTQRPRTMRPAVCQPISCGDSCNIKPIGESKAIADNRFVEDMNLAQNKLDAATGGVDFALAIRASLKTGLKAAALGSGPFGVFAGVLGAIVGTAANTPEQLISELKTQINERLAAVQNCIVSTSNADWANDVYHEVKAIAEQVETQLQNVRNLRVDTVHGRLGDAWGACTAKQVYFQNPAASTAQRVVLMAPAAGLFAQTCWALSLAYVSFLGEQKTISSGGWTRSELDAEVYRVSQEATVVMNEVVHFAKAVRTTMERDFKVEATTETRSRTHEGWKGSFGTCSYSVCKISAPGMTCEADYKYLEVCSVRYGTESGALYLPKDYEPPCRRLRNRFIDEHARNATQSVLPLAKLAYDGCRKIKRPWGESECEAPGSTPKKVVTGLQRIAEMFRWVFYSEK